MFKPRVAIIDSNYSDRKFIGLAATWLKWEIQRAEIKECNPLTADYLLCTVSSQQGFLDLKRELKKHWNGKSTIILGGGGCWAPAVFENIADYLCVGEGQRFIRAFLSGGVDAIRNLPETWIKRERREVIPSDCFPWDCPPLNHPDGTVRVWGARGCRNKCLFCQTGWEQKYNPNKNTAIVQRQVDDLIRAGRRVAMITNDGADEAVIIRGQQEFLSVTYKKLKNIEITRKIAKSIRIGVEGVSERLRQAIGKPVDNDGLLKITKNALSKGVGVRWFFIAGLPLEQSSDWSEIKYLVKGLHGINKGVVMMNFHAYIPQPATPLCVFPLLDNYWEWFNDFRTWFFSGPGFTRHVQIVSPAQYLGRMRRAKESMAATEEEIRRGWFEHDNANWRVKTLLTNKNKRNAALVYKKRLSNNQTMGEK